MATHRVSIININSAPDTSARCYVQTYDITASNDIFKPLVIKFTNPGGGQDGGFYGQFNVPKNYVGTATIIPVWTSTTTSGNVRWKFDYRSVSGDDANSMDQASFEEQTAVTDAAPGATDRRMASSISLTSANLAADETVLFYFYRSDDTGVDTMAGDVVLFDLLFQYADA